jgi:Subtilisin-like serine proteases
MKRAALLALLTIVPFTAFAASAPTQAVIVMTKQSSHFSVKSLSTSFDPNVSADERDLRELPGIHGFVANLTSDDIAALRASGDVLSIEPDYERHAFADTITPEQQTTPYGVTAVDAPPVWAVTRGKSPNGSAVHVAIIDTGIDYNYSELSAVFRSGFNFVSRTTDPLDDNGHGSHVAGIIAAANDGSGVVGIASDVDVFSLKVLDTCGSGRTSDIIQAVEFVIQKKKEIGGNWIVNLSLGSDTASISEQTEFEAASDAGILVFAASGNAYDGTDGLSFPAGYPTVVSVGAVDSTNTVASFSQRGADLKVVAPGVSVLSTFVSPMVGVGDGRKLAAVRADYRDADGNDLAFSACPPATTGISGTFVSCGFGAVADFSASVKGKIALVQRGPLGAGGITFFVKAQNAVTAGAKAIVVYDNAPVDPANPFNPGFFTSATSAATIPSTAPFLGITQADGQALLATPTATVTFSNGFEQFALLSGTSMACPHAVGSAALVWAVSPNSTATNVANALEQTAKDLGVAGKDTTYGFGLVDAFAAAKQLNPSAFAPAGPVKGRFLGRRGH